MTRGGAIRIVVALVATAGLSSCGSPTYAPAQVSPSSPVTVTVPPGLDAALLSAGTPADAGFVAFGDFGGGPAQYAVSAVMGTWARDHRVDALVTTGDNVYERGEPPNFRRQLDEPYAELRRTRPMWVTLGNHDVVAGHGPRQLAHLGLPALPYTRDLPNVRIHFLDGNRPSRAQAGWLDRSLSAPGPGLRVVVFHQPVYSCGPHGSTKAIGRDWAPILERHRVALVLNGHDHNYQRFISARDVTYVVSGGGGRGLYAVPNRCPHEPRKQVHASRHHFVGVEVHGTTLRGEVVASNGDTIDSFAITR